MYEVRCKEGKMLGTYLIKEEAIERMNSWPQGHYVVEVHEIRNLIAVKDDSREASKPKTPEAYF